MHAVIEQGRYNSMEECFEARELLVENVGRPIINYQAVCVSYSKEKLFKDGRPAPVYK
jgi:hypothetical protein